MLVAVLAAPGGSGAAAPTGCPGFDHGHAAWTAILERFVHQGSVDYAGIQREATAALRAYLHALTTPSRECYEAWTREEQLAFWIDVYNACTIRLILDHYPIASIRSIGWLPGAAFRTRFVPMRSLEGKDLSLDDVEHRIIRPRFGDARVHFALVCASKGCPPLRSEAYRATDLDRQLDDQARLFINDPTKNRYESRETSGDVGDARLPVLRLSRIFEWYRQDFERAAGNVPEFVARYAARPMADVARRPDTRVEYLDYDWTLNGR